MKEIKDVKEVREVRVQTRNSLNSLSQGPRKKLCSALASKAHATIANCSLLIYSKSLLSHLLPKFCLINLHSPNILPTFVLPKTYLSADIFLVKVFR